VRPVASVAGDVAWRREVARVTVQRALARLRAEG
jgi:CO/xanthine dehydrogenase FAD-binding subunit